MKKYTALILMAIGALCKADCGKDDCGSGTISVTQCYAMMQENMDMLMRHTKILLANGKCCNSEPSGTVLEPNTQDDFVQASCATTKPAVFSTGVFNLNATQPAVWPRDGFCRVYVKTALPRTNYNISADLFNVNSASGASSGHLGIFYNAQDIDNYDFVYFRLHTAIRCYQTGHVVNGIVTVSHSASCANGVPLAATWFNVKVAVTSGTAKIYKDNVFVYTVTPTFPPRASGGVLVANGYRNLGRFRNVKIVAN